MSTPDFLLVNHGSIVVLNALTDKAKTWIDEHIEDDAQTWGPHGTVIEPRYVEPIIEGIVQDNLRIVA